MAGQIEMALNPEVQRIVLLDGPAVLGDPSQWPSQNNCLQVTKSTVERLIAQGILKPLDPEAAARLLSAAPLSMPPSGSPPAKIRRSKRFERGAGSSRYRPC
ncbi:hypothetical protein J2W92_001115 [Rhizobium leguminosarum]